MDKSEYVHSVFESIASDYDAANERISMGQQIRWKKAAACRVAKGLTADAKILDLCCGTGDMIKLLLDEKPGFEITGLDFSQNMLELAGEKLNGKGELELIQGDAMSLPFRDCEFDAAVIAFALRNTADYEKVISEMVRVVKRGAPVCCIDSFQPEHPMIKPFYHIYFSSIMPFLGGGKERKDEYRWLNESTKSFISPGELKGLMRRCGLEEFSIDRFMFGSCVSICAHKDREA